MFWLVLFPFSFEHKQFDLFVSIWCLICLIVVCSISHNRDNVTISQAKSFYFFSTMRCFLCSMLSDSDCTVFSSRTNVQNSLYCYSHDVQCSRNHQRESVPVWQFNVWYAYDGCQKLVSNSWKTRFTCAFKICN